MHWFTAFYPLTGISSDNAMRPDLCDFWLIGFACAYMRDAPCPASFQVNEAGLFTILRDCILLAYNRVFLLPFLRNLNYDCNLLILWHFYLE